MAYQTGFITFRFKNLSSLFSFCFGLHLHSYPHSTRRRYIPWRKMSEASIRDDVGKLQRKVGYKNKSQKWLTYFITEALQAPVSCSHINRLLQHEAITKKLLPFFSKLIYEIVKKILKQQRTQIKFKAYW